MFWWIQLDCEWIVAGASPFGELREFLVFDSLHSTLKALACTILQYEFFQPVGLWLSLNCLIRLYFFHLISNCPCPLDTLSPAISTHCVCSSTHKGLRNRRLAAGGKVGWILCGCQAGMYGTSARTVPYDVLLRVNTRRYLTNRSNNI